MSGFPFKIPPCGGLKESCQFLQEEIMKLTDLLSQDLKREAEGTRRVLACVPEGRYDWKPHPKSMPLGYLTT
jgi:hypothetical protein